MLMNTLRLANRRPAAAPAVGLVRVLVKGWTTEPAAGGSSSLSGWTRYSGPLDHPHYRIVGDPSLVANSYPSLPRMGRSSLPCLPGE